jgi:ABC-type multidrug transport system fused ATPase/permease subunit
VSHSPSADQPAQPVKAATTLLTLLRWARRYWVSYIAVSVIVILSALLPVGWAEALRRLFDAASQLSMDGLLAAGLWIGCLFVTELVTNLLQALMMTRLSNRTTLDLQREVLGGLFVMRLLRYAKWHTGDKLQRLNQSSAAAQEGINQKIPELTKHILSILFLAIYLTVLSWELMAGSLVVALIMPMLGNLLGKPIHSWQQKTNEAQAETDGRLLDQLQGAEVARSFGLRSSFNASWRMHVERTRVRWLRTDMLRAGNNWAIFLGFWLGQVYIFLMGGWLVVGGQLEIGAIAAFTLSYERLFFPMAHIVNAWAAVQDAVAHAGRVFEMTNPLEHRRIDPNIRRRLQLQLQETKQADSAPLPPSGDIEFRDIRFTYGGDGTNTPTVQGFSATVRDGRLTAIVGPSGGGKSTILKLLLGLYEPDSGTIQCGGTLLHADEWPAWREQVAYVPQDAALFDATAMDNIRIGRLTATDDEVIEAARLANAHAFIQALPEGYRTRLGERGQRLSGGERQRLALARAYVRNPRILLLDEPTSALDGMNEQLMQEALHAIMQGRTVLVVAHRLSTVQHADCILYVENGKVLEAGTHEQLMRLGGRYALLVRAGDWSQEHERSVVN